MNEAQRRAIRRQAIFWSAATLALMLVLWVLGDALLPFVAGAALAYFLDPVADMLERWGISRLLATVIILFFFIVFFILAVLIIVPILGGQVVGFVERLPEYVTRLQALIHELDFDWLDRFKGEDGALLGGSASDLISQGAGWVGTVLERLWASGKALIGIASLLVVTPVVAFYLLYDWDRMVAKIDGWLPLDYRDTIRAIFADINRTVAGFVRGQGTLCLVLGIFYGTALTIAGLNFGLLIGLFAGLISFIPYVGSLVGFLLSVGVALVQFWPDWIPIAIIAGIFFAGQFLEGNVLQPWLVGGSVGLHPVWVMFALFAFGSLFGFTGMLIAVPVAAAIGVIVRFALDRYLQSEMYHGHERHFATKTDPGDDDRA